jgi:5-methylcytosine-specific restriction endonuclease McrA
MPHRPPQHQGLRNDPALARSWAGPLYGLAAWKSPRHGLRHFILTRNPICQRIHDDGRQCTHAAEEVHHVVEERARFWDPTNLVAVCNPCHLAARGRRALRYVPTNVEAPKVG